MKAGFYDEHEDLKITHDIPGYSTKKITSLANESDMGIPGEWLFKVDKPIVHMCGPGFTGPDCSNSNLKTEYV